MLSTHRHATWKENAQRWKDGGVYAICVNLAPSGVFTEINSQTPRADIVKTE